MKDPLTSIQSLQYSGMHSRFAYLLAIVDDAYESVSRWESATIGGRRFAGYSPRFTDENSTHEYHAAL